MDTQDWHFAAEEAPPEYTELLICALDATGAAQFVGGAYYWGTSDDYSHPIPVTAVSVWRLSNFRPDITSLRKSLVPAHWHQNTSLMSIPVTPSQRWHLCNLHLGDHIPICPECLSDVPLSNGFPGRLATGTMVCRSCGHTLTATEPNGLLTTFNISLRVKRNA